MALNNIFWVLTVKFQESDLYRLLLIFRMPRFVGLILYINKKGVF